MKKTSKNNYLTIIVITIVVILIIIGAVISLYKYGYNTGYADCKKDLQDKYSSPVEKIVRDTCYIRKDSLIYRTKYIKDIQHDTIEKVYNLNNDATVDLFNKLVSE